MNKDNLDEMQLQRRNKYGNQAFILLCILIMIDNFLYGIGLHWFSYPVNVFTIMLVCMGYYMVRSVWGNAYIGPKVRNTAPLKKWAILLYPVLLGVIIGIFVSHKDFIKISTEADSDNGAGAIILLVISAASLLLVLTVGLVKNKQNKRDDG